MFSDFESSGQLAGRIWKLREAEVKTASADDLSYLATSDQFGVGLELTLSGSDGWYCSDHDIVFVETSGSAATPNGKDFRSGTELSFYLPDTALVTLEKRSEDIDVYMSMWGGTLPPLYKELGPHDPWARLERFKLWISENTHQTDRVKAAILDRMYSIGFLYEVQMRLHDWLHTAAVSLEDKIAL